MSDTPPSTPPPPGPDEPTQHEHRVEADTFVTMTAIVTFAYLISRGIAKASRVLEQ